MWANKTNISIFSFGGPHCMLLPDCLFCKPLLWVPLSLWVLFSKDNTYLGSLLLPPDQALGHWRFFLELSKGCLWQSIGGSVVEFSPPTRETRVRFPANAYWPGTLHTFSLFCLVHSQVRILRGSGHQEQEKENWKPRGGSEQKTKVTTQLELCKALRCLDIWSSIWLLAAQQLPRWWVRTFQCVSISVGLRFRIFGLVSFQFFSQKVLATQRAIRSLIRTLELGWRMGHNPPGSKNQDSSWGPTDPPVSGEAPAAQGRGKPEGRNPWGQERGCKDGSCAVVARGLWVCALW